MDGVCLKDFTVSGAFEVKDVESCLRKYGAAVLPGWYRSAGLADLREEFTKILDDRDECYIYPINYAPGKAVSIMRAQLPAAQYPLINQAFSDPLMENLARSYIGKGDVLLNYEVYATHEFMPSIDVAPTHFDKLWTLKYMLYLNDIGPGCAPFGVIPGSACVARSRFREIYAKNNLQRLWMDDDRYQTMDNSSLPADFGPVVDITGPAGTLIVFDTDTFHHAGVVAEGRERMILRGHSGPAITYKSVRKGSRQWWRGERPFGLLDIWKDKLLNKFT